ncbi:MAG: superoxide dismutase [Alphaproteobacteria bacterium]|nr:superoxide dismutase [Alphaproteobacteria bacterium]
MTAFFTLPSLPFADDSLAPVISANTMGFHYGKHHKAYVDNLNKLAVGTEYAECALEEIARKTAGHPDKAGLFNNAAQAWNHAFFWESLLPGGGGKPSGKMAELIDRDLGGYDKFKADFLNAGLTQFGSGWAWLVSQNGKLAILKTPNAETPLTGPAKPLLTIDVWEHAYYLDYQNRRADFLSAVIDKLLNWDKALERLNA